MTARRRRRWWFLAGALLLLLAGFLLLRANDRILWEIEGLTSSGPVIVSPEGDVLVRRGPVLELIDRRGDSRELPIASPFLRPVASAGEHGFIAISDQRGVAETALLDWTGRKRWSLPVTGSAVTVAPGGMVYFFCPPEAKLYAVNLDGTIAWTRMSSGGTREIAFQVGADDSIAFREGRRGRILIMSKEGTIRWQVPEATDGSQRHFGWDAKHGLAVVNEENAIEFFAPDGRKRWTRSTAQTNSLGLATQIGPFIFGVAISPTGFTYCHSSDGSVDVLDAEGEYQWSYPRGEIGLGGSWIAFTGEGAAIFGSSDSRVLRTASPLTLTASAMSNYAEFNRRLVCLAPDGQLLWEIPVPGSPVWKLPRSVDELKASWETRFGMRSFDPIRWPVIGPDGTVYFCRLGRFPGKGSQIYAVRGD